MSARFIAFLAAWLVGISAGRAASADEDTILRFNTLKAEAVAALMRADAQLALDRFDEALGVLGPRAGPPWDTARARVGFQRADLLVRLGRHDEARAQFAALLEAPGLSAAELATVRSRLDALPPEPDVLPDPPPAPTVDDTSVTGPSPTESVGEVSPDRVVDASPPARSGVDWGPLIVGGVGVAALGLGVALHLDGAAMRVDARDTDLLHREAAALEDGAQSRFTAAGVLYVAGGATLIGATLWLLFDEVPPIEATPVEGGAVVSVRGRL